jgi:hypothetical protein
VIPEKIASPFGLKVTFLPPESCRLALDMGDERMDMERRSMIDSR